MPGLPILSNEDLDHMFENRPEYLGTFSKDLLSTVKIPKTVPSFAVINLQDEDKGTGTHWVAMFNDPNDKKYIYYFDSYGVVPPADVEVWLKKKTGKQVLYSTSEIQNLKSTSCGWFCAAFIYNSLMEQPFLDFVNLFDRSGDKKYYNERMLFMMVQELRLIQ